MSQWSEQFNAWMNSAPSSGLVWQDNGYYENNGDALAGARPLDGGQVLQFYGTQLLMPLRERWPELVWRVEEDKGFGTGRWRVTVLPEGGRLGKPVINGMIGNEEIHRGGPNLIVAWYKRLMMYVDDHYFKEYWKAATKWDQDAFIEWLRGQWWQRQSGVRVQLRAENRAERGTHILVRTNEEEEHHYSRWDPDENYLPPKPWDGIQRWQLELHPRDALDLEMALYDQAVDEMRQGYIFPGQMLGLVRKED